MSAGIERSDRVRLDVNESRCQPKACVVQHHCVRRMAQIPPMGRVGDFSLEPNWGGTATCEGYLSLAIERKARASTVPGPTRHGPMGGRR